MHITFVLPPVGMAGGVKVVTIYAQQLKQRGHTVRVISPPRSRPKFGQKLESWLKGNGWPEDPTSPRSYLDGSGIDHQLLDMFRPVVDDDVPDGDIIIATFWRTAEWVARLSDCKGAKVYFIQGHEAAGQLEDARVRATYRLPFHKIVVAHWLEQLMREQYSDNIVDVVPNSVDRTQFFTPIRSKQPKPTVGFLWPKGWDTTPAALQLVRKHVPDLRMISFGSQRPTRRMPLPKGSEFFYLPPQDKIRDLYARCDVWLSTSRSEGFNLPALEAMACRTPVVSTRTGWPAEAIKLGTNGVLVDPDDVYGLAQGVQWVLSRTDEEWRTLSANAFATSATGSWQESAVLFEQAMWRACSRSARKEIAGTCSFTPLGAALAVPRA
jgi:glycosyltransferase involved in cell wall biosynthesis